MDCEKVGKLIKELRLEKKLTQKQVADQMNISDKTVSKWERGFGCPDISLIRELSEILGVNIENVLKGELLENDFVGGNMKNTKFYVCPACGNISLCTGDAQVSCCGRKLEALNLKKAEHNRLQVEYIEDECYLTSDHPMDKENYISFVALMTGDKVQVFKQYPEWALQVRIPKLKHGKIVWYSTSEGLFYQLI